MDKKGKAVALADAPLLHSPSASLQLVEVRHQLLRPLEYSSILDDLKQASPTWDGVRLPTEHYTKSPEKLKMIARILQDQLQTQPNAPLSFYLGPYPRHIGASTYATWLNSHHYHDLQQMVGDHSGARYIHKLALVTAHAPIIKNVPPMLKLYGVATLRGPREIQEQLMQFGSAANLYSLEDILASSMESLPSSPICNL